LRTEIYRVGSIAGLSEREFQQLVAWENNWSVISNATEYLITDIEYADVRHSARLDMLGLRWLSADRKDGSRCSPVFIEMKYGIGAYDGDAGIAEHITDLNAILSDQGTRDQLNPTIAAQFNQLSGLDLVQFHRSIKVERKADHLSPPVGQELVQSCNTRGLVVNGTRELPRDEERLIGRQMDLAGDPFVERAADAERSDGAG